MFKIGKVTTIIFVFLAAFGWLNETALAQSQGANDPSAAIGTWNDPTNALTSDNACATATSTGISVSLALTDYGFSIPATATVVGVRVEAFVARDNLVGGNKSLNFRLLVAGSPAGDTKPLRPLTATPPAAALHQWTLWAAVLIHGACR